MPDYQGDSNLEDTEKFFQDIREKPDEELVNYTAKKLEKSYGNREYPFHPSHDVIDKLQDEFKRRNKRSLYLEAFNRFDEEASIEREVKK